VPTPDSEPYLRPRDDRMTATGLRKNPGPAVMESKETQG